jgi:cytochrome c biogenesis protein CcmG/thiol:disulfide interchange protein DsbE
MARYLIPLGVFIILVGFFLFGLQPGYDPKLVPSPLIGKPAPAFVLPQLKTPEQTLDQDDLKGKVSLVNVWASWCVECRTEHPFLMQLARTGTIPIYGLNYKDTREEALGWLDRHGDPYTAVAFDGKGTVGIDYGVPETFVIDQKGVIRFKHIGPITPSVWKDRIKPVIDQLEVAQK